MNAEKAVRDFKYYIDNDMFNYLVDDFEKMISIKKNLDTPGYHDTKPEYRPNFEYIFNKIYLHACLKKKRLVIEYLNRVYENMGDIEKIALRPTLIYAMYLLKK